ncbi:Arf GTPase activating protein [Heterostelium album PN500]|uniref:Arf GTPase activating protein n=1 Tax=Heterostelium pallidum (strain ATCC 26659 / Pp 5 / PN500) TaxID=670386 RepID=D3B9L6_HETP5|nr:Arf GTPase activating protein [Heterostelium album PN500]EFA81928.1 Arf GTPase activating protein [Heterostelium album PN500]|eukprot:XP_020434045.1 Arf GTPase activating protein [Heterostelium album PN500]
MMEKSKNETILWDLRELEENNKCADCTDSFPRFLNTSLGTFVCSVCGAVHRELGHRVKSLASDKFNDEEIEKLKNIGNKKAQDIWLSKWTEKEFPTPLPSDEKKVREFIKLKYVEKKWAALEQLTPSKLKSPVNKNNSVKVPPSPANIENVTSPQQQQQQHAQTVTSPNERKSNLDSRKSISKEFENLSLSSDSNNNLNNSTASIASMYENGNASKYAPLPSRNTGNTSSVDSNGKPFNPFREENKYFTEKKETFPPFSKEPYDQHTYLKEKSSFYQKVKLDQPRPRTPPTHAQSTNNLSNLNYSKPNPMQSSVTQSQPQPIAQTLMITGSAQPPIVNNTFNPFVDQSLNQQPNLLTQQQQSGMMNSNPQLMSGNQQNMMYSQQPQLQQQQQQPMQQQTGMLALPAPQQSSLFGDLLPSGYQQPQQQQPLALPAPFQPPYQQQQQSFQPQQYQQQQQFKPQQSFQQNNMMMQQQQQPHQEPLPLDELFGLKSVNPEPVFPSSEMSFENGNQLDYDEDQNRAWRDIEDKKRQYLKDHEIALKLQNELNSRPQTPPAGLTRERSKTEPPPPLRSSASSGLRSSQNSTSTHRNRSRSSSMESSQPSASYHKNTTTHPLHSSTYQTDSYDYRAHDIVASSRYNRNQQQANNNNQQQQQQQYLEDVPRDYNNIQSPRHSTNQMVVYNSDSNAHAVECDACGTKTSFDALTHHKNTDCLFRPMKCTYCNKLIKYIQYNDHQDLCQTKLFTCGVCGRSVPGRDMPYHMSSFHNR